MKILNLKLLLFLVVGSFLFTSCNNSENIDLSESISADETNIFVEADNISDEVNNVIDDFFVEESLGARSEDNNPTDLSSLGCMTRTVVVEGTIKTVTLDFGDGCELPNGTVLSGKIILVHAVDTDVKSLIVTYTFENFYFNELNIEGENTVVRVRENENGNPQSTLTVNMKITWPDGEFASRRGTKVREWIEGYDTRTFGDNVFLITGNWTTTFKNGTILSATIIEPLRREMDCRFIVSGVVELQKNNRNGSLNFGDGRCDNKAIFTNEEGEEFEVTLRGKMF
ncbi:hypothetical protein MNBD_BACTEROID04-682 [hydrothermal vent metagenome]|uniref:Lipoprotein n=1 Tax=hydrothermal vent metagenome TaxID=652676 RepID=A0A3B0ULW0_9ZZZZ